MVFRRPSKLAASISLIFGGRTGKGKIGLLGTQTYQELESMEVRLLLSKKLQKDGDTYVDKNLKFSIYF